MGSSYNLNFTIDSIVDLFFFTCLPMVNTYLSMLSKLSNALKLSHCEVKNTINFIGRVASKQMFCLEDFNVSKYILGFMQLTFCGVGL